MQPMNWDDYQIFLALQRGQSHARAARALGVNATTIGRRLAALEGALGARLFQRTPAGLSLTPSGEAILVRVERVEAELLAAQRELAGADTRAVGTVRLTSGDALASYVLVPGLVELRRRHPQLFIELRADTRALDLSRREADVALRLARPKEPSFIARRAGHMRFALYASRPYLDQRGTPRAAKELAEHDFIGFEAELDQVPQVKWLRRLLREPRWVFRANTTTAQAAACAAGHGIALLPTFVAAHEPNLVPLLPRLDGPVRELWAVTHADLRKNARVALVVDWLTALLADT